MGCGSSSLKGEKMVDSNTSVSESSPQPIKKVRTNFSDVDYSAASQHRRNTEYAPTETERRPTTVPEEKSMPGADTDAMGAARAHDATTGSIETKLQPYRSNEGNGVTGHGHEPTTTGVKIPFYTSHSPTTNASSSPDFKAAFVFNNALTSTPAADPLLPVQVQTPRKQSLYDRYQAIKAGRNGPYTDDELRKYIGKTNAELNEWARTTPGVGQNQPAGDATLSGNRLASGNAWG